MINVAICDDDADALLRLQEMLAQWSASHGHAVSASAFLSGETLLYAVRGNHIFDLYILDILMPGLNGIALGKCLRAERIVGRDIPIIYLTSSPEFAVESYEVRAFFYLLKPVSQARFDELLSEAMEQVDRLKSRFIPVRTKTGTWPVTYDEICYVIREERALTYLCSSRTVTSMTIQGSFKSATAQLAAEPRFFLCGASMLLNLGQIKSIDKNDVTFSNDVRLTVPRITAKPLYKAWLDYWLE